MFCYAIDTSDVASPDDYCIRVVLVSIRLIICSWLYHGYKYWLVAITAINSKWIDITNEFWIFKIIYVPVMGTVMIIKQFNNNIQYQPVQYVQ